MTQRIWKYELTPGWETDLVMPQDAEILSAGAQGEAIVIWSIVTPDMPTERRTFRVYPTGSGISRCDPERFIATVQMGELVFHLFEVRHYDRPARGRGGPGRHHPLPLHADRPATVGRGARWWRRADRARRRTGDHVMTMIPKPDTFDGVDPGDTIFVEQMSGAPRQVWRQQPDGTLTDLSHVTDGVEPIDGGFRIGGQKRKPGTFSTVDRWSAECEADAESSETHRRGRVRG